MLLTRRADGAAARRHRARPTITIPELPAAVEVAAYRIVTEALTNVDPALQRHLSERHRGGRRVRPGRRRATTTA